MRAVLGRMLFPALARVQDDLEHLRRDYLRACAGFALLTFPMAAGIAVVAEPFISAALGEKWLPAVRVVEIFAPITILQGSMWTAGAIYRARGRADWLMRWGLGSGLVILLGYLSGVRWGLEGLVIGYGFATVLLAYPAFRIPFQLIDLPVRGLITELWPYVLATGLMTALALAVRIALEQLGAPALLVLLGSAASGAAAYAAFIIWRKPPALHDLRRLVLGARRVEPDAVANDPALHEPQL